MSPERVVSAERLIHAPAEQIFALIADPSKQPSWDGNDNLADAPEGQRVHAAGDVFVMHNSSGKTKENHVTIFEEGRSIAWKPADAGNEPSGHQWGWELEPVEGGTLVRHIYDYSGLNDGNPTRMAKAQATTADMLMASINRLAQTSEN